MITKILLFAPREHILYQNEELEYREANIKTYKDFLESGSVFGSDYTVLKEYLGISCIASVLRQNGYKVKVLIAGNGNLTDEEIVDEICSFQPDILGVSLLYDLQLYNALKISAIIKKQMPSVGILFGGSFASVDAEILLNRFHDIDYIIRGEGEKAVIDLLYALQNRLPVDSIKGLSYRQGNAVVNNEVDQWLELDSLPLISRDVLSEMKQKKLPINTAYIYTSRGCKGTCTFCTVPDLNRKFASKWRGRDPVKVVDEMEFLVNTYGVRYFYMTDDNFFGTTEDDMNRLHTFSHEIIRRGLKINFHAECRVDSLDESIVLNLKKAGFDQLLLGIESGSNTTLRRWGKKQTVLDNEKAIEIGRKYNFDLMPSMILLDWESTLEELVETVDFIERNKIYNIKYPLSLVNKIHILRGTAAARRYDKIHGLSDDFPITNEESLRQWIIKHTYQDITIENIYVAAFWKYLSRVANKWYFISQGIIPQFLLSFRNIDSTDSDAMEFISKCRVWRKKLGFNLMRLMRSLINELVYLQSNNVVLFDLSEKVREWETAWEKEIFALGLDEELHNNKRILIKK
jgi:radical SAM superfamily enzyme YgiQ (UPF0313 family)